MMGVPYVIFRSVCHFCFILPTNVNCSCSDTSGDVTLYWDYAAGKMHSIVGCGAVADAHSFLLCGPNGPVRT